MNELTHDEIVCGVMDDPSMDWDAVKAQPHLGDDLLAEWLVRWGIVIDGAEPEEP